MTVAQVALLVVALGMAPPVRRFLHTRIAAAMLGVGIAAATVLCGALIVGVPDPQIDVLYLLIDGPRALLNGSNPYNMTFTELQQAGL
jgi:hypothetical protein